MKQPSTNEQLGIRPVKKIKRPRSWAIYGRSGSGKTTFAASFPKPILLLDVRDQGTDSIMDEEQLDVKDIESLDDLEDVYYYLKEKPKAYKTIVIDTITQMQQIFMEEVSKKKRNSGRVGDWGSMTRREFGDVAALMKEWINNYRNLTALGMEIIFIAQERTSTQEEENPDNMLVPEVGPQVFPSVATVLNANVSIIGNTFIRIKHNKTKKNGQIVEKKLTQYCLRIGPNPIYTTKIRKPKNVTAPGFIENATYMDVIEVINNGEADGEG
jgi:phage nucleotide-binding protein